LELTQLTIRLNHGPLLCVHMRFDWKFSTWPGKLTP
jgi:hypothetical protein